MSDLNELHQIPLANRLVDDLIREWLDVHTDLAIATASANGWRQAGIVEMRHLHLDGYHYQLTPKILDALRRAGLLNSEPSQ